MPANATRDTVLDALGVLLALNRGDAAAADQLYASYAAENDVAGFASAAYGIALLAVRYAAQARGETAETILAGVAQEVRAL